MGNAMADLRYGTVASCQATQDHGFLYCNTDGSGHPHLDALEFFNPNLSADPFHWILCQPAATLSNLHWYCIRGE